MSDTESRTVEEPRQPDQPAPAEIAAPAAARLVENDRLCLQCEYNLRGLGVDHLCPECGAPVARSLQWTGLLMDAPASYLARLHRGTLLVLCGLVAPFAPMLAMIASLPLLFFFSPPSAALNWVSMATLPAASLLLVVGWSMLAAQEPGRTPTAPMRSTKRLLRILGVGLVLCVMPSLLASVWTAWRGGQPWVGFLRAGLTVLWYALLLGHMVAALALLRRLALRVPNPGLARYALRLTWLVPLLATLGACLVLGPLVALLLMIIAVGWLRSNLTRVREAQRRSLASARA